MPWFWVIGGIGALYFGGRAVKDAGDGVDAAGNGALKIALVAGGGYLLARKMGVLR